MFRRAFAVAGRPDMQLMRKAPAQYAVWTYTNVNVRTRQVARSLSWTRTYRGVIEGEQHQIVFWRPSLQSVLQHTELAAVMPRCSLCRCKLVAICHPHGNGLSGLFDLGGWRNKLFSVPPILGRLITTAQPVP